MSALSAPGQGLISPGGRSTPAARIAALQEANNALQRSRNGHPHFSLSILVVASDSPAFLRRRISARIAASSAFGHGLFSFAGSMPTKRSAAFQEPNKFSQRFR